MVVDETGGSHGVREHSAILSLVSLPQQKAFGKELYDDIFIKSAIYARNVIMVHPFIDGNKRTGMSASLIFLEYNNYKITAKEGDIEKFALRVVKEKLSLKDIAVWLKKHSKKLN